MKPFFRLLISFILVLNISYSQDIPIKSLVKTSNEKPLMSEKLFTTPAIVQEAIKKPADKPIIAPQLEKPLITPINPVITPDVASKTIPQVEKIVTTPPAIEKAVPQVETPLVTPQAVVKPTPQVEKPVINSEIIKNQQKNQLLKTPSQGIFVKQRMHKRTIEQNYTTRKKVESTIKQCTTLKLIQTLY